MPRSYGDDEGKKLSDVMTTVMMTTNKALPSAVMTLMTTKKFANEF